MLLIVVLTDCAAGHAGGANDPDGDARGLAFTGAMRVERLKPLSGTLLDYLGR
jgi:hypothetical protein